jgi:hypothetical protein
MVEPSPEKLDDENAEQAHSEEKVYPDLPDQT